MEGHRNPVDTIVGGVEVFDVRAADIVVKRAEIECNRSAARGQAAAEDGFFEDFELDVGRIGGGSQRHGSYRGPDGGPARSGSAGGSGSSGTSTKASSSGTEACGSAAVA